MAVARPGGDGPSLVLKVKDNTDSGGKFALNESASNITHGSPSLSPKTGEGVPEYDNGIGAQIKRADKH